MKNPLKRLNHWTDEHPGPALIITSSLCTLAGGMACIYQDVIGDRMNYLIVGLMIAMIVMSVAATLDKHGRGS